MDMLDALRFSRIGEAKIKSDPRGVGTARLTLVETSDGLMSRVELVDNYDTWSAFEDLPLKSKMECLEADWESIDSKSPLSILASCIDDDLPLQTSSPEESGLEERKEEELD